MDEIEQRAEMLRALAHPQRLCIVAGLRTNRCNVGTIQQRLGLTQSGLSQHLSKLRAAGIIRGVRNGKQICYEVIRPEAAEIARMLTDGLMDCGDQQDKECGKEGQV